MKIEMLFRGQPIGNKGRWIEGIGAYKTQTAEHLITNAKGDSVEVVHLCRYTGLKDKNGNKIFEGDILVCGQWTALVLWNEELATFALRFPFEDKVGSTPLGEWQTMAILSNVYDNPELLECEEDRWKKSK